MQSIANVSIHASQFPEQVRRDLKNSLRTRQVAHKFHYDSVKQAQKWLALHQAYSPSRNDPDCVAIYEQGFQEACSRLASEAVHLVGLGCGGGQKDQRLLQILAKQGVRLSYTPLDVSTALVLIACEAASTIIPKTNCFPLVCDLASVDDLPEILQEARRPAAIRLFTFFGMLPNFEPHQIVSKLARLMDTQDLLLLSANLAPGTDYAAGLQRVLPQYDNALTRDWLVTFLLDCGVEPNDGEVRFRIEDDPFGSGPKRIAAYFEFSRTREMEVMDERFLFAPGDAIRLFFSYRYTAPLICQLLGEHDLTVAAEWITRSQEEGVFLIAGG